MEIICLRFGLKLVAVKRKPDVLFLNMPFNPRSRLISVIYEQKALAFSPFISLLLPFELRGAIHVSCGGGG